MLFGVALPNVGPLADGHATLAVATAAEALGYGSVWTSDHLLIPPDGGHRLDCLEALTTLALLAGRTERVRLGTSVLITPLREPVLLAKQAATIQELSGGRLVLGLGVGWLESEFELLGVDFAGRGARTDTVIEILEHLLTVPTGPTDPGREQLRCAFSPDVTHTVPIVIGGSSRYALRRAATRGSGWHAVWLEPDDVLARVSAIAALGPRPGFEVSLRIDTDLGAGPSHTARGLIGPPDAVVRKVRQYEDAGVHELVIDFMDRDDHSVPPLDVVLDQMARFRALVGEDRW